MSHMTGLLLVLLASVAGIVVLLVLMLRPMPPLRWLPPAPSYAFVALFSAGYNAVVARSPWATAACLGLAGVFWFDRWLETSGVPREVLVVVGAVAILVADAAWFVAGQPGVR